MTSWTIYTMLTNIARVPSATSTQVKGTSRTPASSSPPPSPSPLPEPLGELVLVGSAVASAGRTVRVVTTPVRQLMSKTGQEVTVNVVVKAEVGIKLVAPELDAVICSETCD